ncbi:MULTISPECIES: carbohydrate ABC transporter permease [Clostridium]|uniref:Carbohydrate ABC transporter permease n=1 Tax=Clostridium cibarium TaxID=2762247 RepID=A0ABR8PTA0_9CLOT|nr:MULTISPECIES: carbohydrate ABC transporter permease [Clostridium]MBD7911402.1 carbohydrate ABC transporter permease [Clostridium cibarium]
MQELNTDVKVERKTKKLSVLKKQEGKVNWPVTILLILCSLTILFPLYITIVIAFKQPSDMTQNVLSLPKTWNFSNFAEAIEMTNFFHVILNSLIITGGAIVVTIVTNSLVAYAIARNMHKKFYKFVYYFFVSAMFVPFSMLMLPLVKQVSAFNLDNRLGMIILYMVYGISMNTLLYVGYLKNIPLSLEEAAYVDGASPWTVFWKIIFPLMKPMHATVGIMTALWVWNDVMMPLVILSDQNAATLPLAQFIFQSKFGTNYNVAFASYLLALLPLLVFYLFAQKWIINGVTKGAIK